MAEACRQLYYLFLIFLSLYALFKIIQMMNCTTIETNKTDIPVDILMLVLPYCCARKPSATLTLSIQVVGNRCAYCAMPLTNFGKYINPKITSNAVISTNISSRIKNDSIYTKILKLIVNKTPRKNHFLNILIMLTACHTPSLF